jgi:uncharacterized protein (UPF0276 family)
LKEVVRLAEPFIVSEHLAWSGCAGISFPDLLPFPRTRESLTRIARNIDITQSALGRQLFIENPSLYLQLPGHEIPEPEFLSELVRLTGCGLLVDVNNVYVSSRNLGFDPVEYLARLPSAAIGEIHLAGHAADGPHAGALLIDTHGAPVAEEVWSLYGALLERVGPRPTLIERDDNLPAFPELLSERERANDMLVRSERGMRHAIEERIAHA